jgi:hypothetical protein
MGVWKFAVYPFGLAIIGIAVVDLIGTAMFGADSGEWLTWQVQFGSALGTAAGFAGAMSGLYLAIRSQARLIP